MRDRTTLVVAHRLSTIRHADLICVLHEGRIVEMGRHDDLLRQDGYYRKLVEMQK
jgi:ABC-type multidrug transport system fused ATPase/permease subunit